MDIDLSQVLPATALGTFIGWYLRYVFVRWHEKKHLDEGLDRGAKAVTLAERLLELHEKAVEKDVTMYLPMDKQILKLMPSTGEPPGEDDDELDDEDDENALLVVGQWWLFSLMWHCVTLQQLKGMHRSSAEDLAEGLDEAIAHAEDCFLSAYHEMNAPPLVHDYEDKSLVRMLHAYHEYCSQKTELSADAVLIAYEQWIQPYLADDEDSAGRDGPTDVKAID